PVRFRIVLRNAQGALQVDLAGADRGRLVKRHVWLPHEEIRLAEFSQRRDQAQIFVTTAFLDDLYDLSPGIALLLVKLQPMLPAGLALQCRYGFQAVEFHVPRLKAEDVLLNVLYFVEFTH